MDVGVTVGDSLDRLESTADGFSFVELSIGESALDPDRTNTSRLENALSEVGAGITIHLPFHQVVSTPVGQLNDAIVEYQSELLDWAGSIGATRAVLHGTMRDPHDTDQRDVFAEQVSAITSAGSSVGVEVVVENVGHQARGLPLSVLGDVARRTETTICFDTGHAYMEGGNEAIERFLDEFGDIVGYLHVHDARSRGDTHLPVGAGAVDFALVAETICPNQTPVAIEVFTDDVPMLRDTARRVRTVFESQ